MPAVTACELAEKPSLFGDIFPNARYTKLYLNDAVQDMENQSLQRLTDTLTDRDNLKSVRNEALAFYKSHPASECFNMALELYQTKSFQIQEVGVFLLGYVANEKAVALISSLNNDESEYVRKSVGNALRDISKKHPDLVKAELLSWDISSKWTMQVFKLAGKLVIE